MSDVTRTFGDISREAEEVGAFKEAAQPARRTNKERADNRRRMFGWLMLGSMLSTEIYASYNALFNQPGPHPAPLLTHEETAPLPEIAQLPVISVVENMPTPNTDLLNDVFDAGDNIYSTTVLAMRLNLLEEGDLTQREAKARNYLTELYRDHPGIMATYLNGIADKITNDLGGNPDALSTLEQNRVLTAYAAYVPSEKYRKWDHMRRNAVMDLANTSPELVNARDAWAWPDLAMRETAIKQYIYLRTVALHDDGLPIDSTDLKFEQIATKTTMAYFNASITDPAVVMRAASMTNADGTVSEGLIDWDYDHTFEVVGHEFDHRELFYIMMNLDKPEVSTYVDRYNIREDILLLRASWIATVQYKGDAEGKLGDGYRINLMERDAWTGMGDAKWIGMADLSGEPFRQYEDGLVRTNVAFANAAAKLRPGYKVDVGLENVTFELSGIIEPVASKAPSPLPRPKGM